MDYPQNADDADSIIRVPLSIVLPKAEAKVWLAKGTPTDRTSNYILRSAGLAVEEAVNA